MLNVVSECQRLVTRLSSVAGDNLFTKLHIEQRVVTPRKLVHVHRPQAIQRIANEQELEVRAETVSDFIRTITGNKRRMQVDCVKCFTYTYLLTHLRSWSMKRNKTRYLRDVLHAQNILSFDSELSRFCHAFHVRSLEWEQTLKLGGQVWCRWGTNTRSPNSCPLK